MNIYATLSHLPTKKDQKLTKTQLIRGASAELNYSLIDKPFTLEDLNQVTVTLKQGRNLFWYTLFTYAIKSLDTEVNLDKTYYKAESIEEGSLQCKLIKVENPTGNPSTSNYFELSDESALDRKTTHHVIDSHFCITNMDIITFNLGSAETKQLKANAEVEVEITLHINTNKLGQSVIIDSQPTLEVVDSLYSQIEEVV